MRACPRFRGPGSPLALFLLTALVVGCGDTDDLVIGPGSANGGNGADGNGLVDVGSGDAVAADTASDTADIVASPDTGADITVGCPTGKPCDDGNACTVNDTCQDGACKSGEPRNCDDFNVCTQDSCSPETGLCAHQTLAAVPCSDGNACTSGDTCKDGACVGAAIGCDDGNPCTIDGCAPVSGCTHLPPTAKTPCDDGSACTLGDACTAGGCVGPGKPDCDDGDVCTIDTCDSQKGCQHLPQPDGTPCDDGLACTKGETCLAGTCNADASACGCTTDAECAPTGKVDLCKGKPVCEAKDGVGTCVIAAGSAVVCNDGDGCKSEACDPDSGTCVGTPAADGKACDDGDACTVGDACKAGVCAPGAAADCDDGNVCTDDACKDKVGCVHTPNTAACDADGNGCTVFDGCDAGLCKPGAAKVCFDGNPCTIDSCDANTGQCQADAAAAEGLICDADGSVCTVADVCKAGKCAPGNALPCDDGNPCTTDSCHPIDGCIKTPNAQSCEDGDLCTVGDGCAAGVCKAGAVKGCDDGDKCTVDSCAAATGKCVHDKLAGCSKPCSADADCKDDNACTAEVCDSGTCKTTAVAGTCDDGSACTVGDACSAGACAPGKAKDCDDGNPCTDDGCHPVAGCTHVANAAPCDADGSACTPTDVCKDKACTLGAAKSCDDGSPCSKDACDAKTGNCTHDGTPFEGGACDADGSVCTVGDACKAGACLKGAALPCDDGKSCTVDACDPKTGCTHTAKAGSCSDGDACTSGDACDSKTGACTPGAAKSCDDGDACTTDSCDKQSGACKNAAIPGCGGGCKLASECDDGKACTDDACKDGACVHSNRSGPCADADACALSGSCSGGACVGGTSVDCDDGKVCTDDACDPKTGQCSWTTNKASCDDGNPCTEADACALGVCKAGKAKDCDDGKVCTNDACDPKTGACLHSDADGKGCDDGDACTADDVCSKGACKPSGKSELTLTIGTGKAGYKDGAAAIAQFELPWALGRGNNGAIVVADLGSHSLRQIMPDGTVSTLAGTGKPGFQDGPAAGAQFWSPAAVDKDADGNLYIADLHNHRVRMLTPKGVVSTFAGDGKAGYKDGFKSLARFDLPTGIAVDAAGVYVSELTNQTIRLVTWDGQVVTVAGVAGQKGYKNGPGSQALFNQPYGLAVGPGGGLYIADSGNHRVRFLTAGGDVLTAAGSTQGYLDGPIQVALLDEPIDVSALPTGDVLVADRGNKRVRLMALDGTIKTLYGDGNATTLSEPFGVVADFAGNAYVCSFDGHRVYKLRMPVAICDDGDPCSVDACDAKTGACKATTASDGTSCGDGCYGTQTCKAGLCQAGFPKDCDDGNKCTSDYCSDGVCKSVPVPNCGGG